MLLELKIFRFSIAIISIISSGTSPECLVLVHSGLSKLPPVKSIWSTAPQQLALLPCTTKVSAMGYSVQFAFLNDLPRFTDTRVRRTTDSKPPTTQNICAEVKTLSERRTCQLLWSAVSSLVQQVLNVPLHFMRERLY